MAFPTSANQVQAFSGAMYGLQIGSVTMAQINNDITAYGGLNNALNSYYTASFGSATTASVATTVATNLGLTGDSLAAGTAYITAQLNAAAAGARGAVIANTLNLFSGLASDATFGAAATAWNAKVDLAAAYTGSTNVAIGSVVVAAGEEFALTTGIDRGADFTGGAGNDSFSGAASTLTALDALDGGAGSDSLSLSSASAITQTATSYTVSNIETANVVSAGVVTVDSSAWSGLTALNVNSTGGSTLTAASTTDILVNDIAVPLDNSIVSIDGGNAITLALATANATTDGDANAEIVVGATTAPKGAVTVSLTGDYAAGSDNTMPGIAVTGGSTVSVTTATGLTAAQIVAENAGTNNTITQGAITVTGTATTTTTPNNVATTAVTVNQAAAVTEVDTAGIGRVGIAAGAVTVNDANRASTTAAGTISTVSIKNAGAVTVNSGALTTLNLEGKITSVDAGTLGALTTAANSAVALNLTGVTTTGAVTFDADIKTINIQGSTTASTIASLVAASSTTGATTINVSGDAKVTVTDNTAGLVTAVNVTNTAGFVLGTTAIRTNTTFTGGAGNDGVVVANGFTKPVSMGAGNDTVTYSGPASTTTGTTGTITGGDGTDVIKMTTTLAGDVDDSSVFNATVTGFETLQISDAHTTTVDLDGVNAVTKVVLTAGSNGGTLTNLASGGTVDVMAQSAGNLTVNVKGALTGVADTLNVNLLSTSAMATTRTITSANVETVNIGVADASVSPVVASTAVVHLLTLAATSAQTIVVSGNNGLTLTNTGNVNVTKFDASGVVANSTAATLTTAATSDAANLLAVTFTSANNDATDTVTITGGAGNDSLTGNDAIDVISGGAGVDTLDGAAGADTIDGGAGADVITGGTGADTLTGGAGNDTYLYSFGDSDVVAFDTITDLSITDRILVGTSTITMETANTGTSTTAAISASNGVATFAHLSAEAYNDLSEKVVLIDAVTSANEGALFSHDGSTFFFVDGGGSNDLVIKLVGVALPGVDTAQTTSGNGSATGLIGFGS